MTIVTKFVDVFNIFVQAANLGLWIYIVFQATKAAQDSVTGQAAKAACIRFSWHLAAQVCPQHYPILNAQRSGEKRLQHRTVTATVPHYSFGNGVVITNTHSRLIDCEYLQEIPKCTSVEMVWWCLTVAIWSSSGFFVLPITIQYKVRNIYHTIVVIWGRASPNLRRSPVPAQWYTHVHAMMMQRITRVCASNRAQSWGNSSFSWGRYAVPAMKQTSS